MRHCFSYEYGYINIDSDNVFFTNTGNWSEVRALEKHDQKKQNLVKKTSLLTFLVMLVICYVQGMMYGINSLTFAIGTPVGILAVYRYFRPEFGPKIKMPFESIIEIEIDRRDVSVVFRDINNEICKEVITRCDEKGITILKDLQDNL